MPSDSAVEKKEGRFARHVRVAKQLRREPRSVVSLFRGWLLDLWQARGGGFYGLGCVITFISLEVKMLAADIAGSDSVSEAVVFEALEYVARFGFLSFVNGFLALLWPAFLLQWLNAWGFVVLLAGYIGFERGLRPLIETWFPELKEARVRKEWRKREREDKKRIKKANKGSQ